MNLGFLVNDITANGGVEGVVISLANKLSQDYNYNVKIISLNKGTNSKIGFELNSYIEVLYLNYKNKHNGALTSCFSELMFLNKNLRKVNLDILITTKTYHSVYMTFLKSLLKIKVIASHHEEYSSDTPKWNMLKKILYKRLNAIILLTKSDYEIYKNFNKNSYIIPNAIPFKSEYSYDISSKKILTLSRLSVEKSIEYSIRALEQLKEKHRDWILEIVGEGSDKDRLSNIIKELNLEDRVSITGFEKNVIEKYKSAAFTILTSQKEGFGCVLIESKAVGVPCISFNNVGPSEIIKNSIDGYIVEKNNLNDLIECMDKLMSNETQRIKMSKKAYDDSRNYNIEAVCEKWHNIICEI